MRCVARLDPPDAFAQTSAAQTGEDDIPTTLRRAAAPTPQAQPAAGVMDALLLARIALIVKSLRIEGAGKKLRRKAVQEVCLTLRCSLCALRS